MFGGPSCLVGTVPVQAADVEEEWDGKGDAVVGARIQERFWNPLPLQRRERAGSLVRKEAERSNDRLGGMLPCHACSPLHLGLRNTCREIWKYGIQ